MDHQFSEELLVCHTYVYNRAIDRACTQEDAQPVYRRPTSESPLKWRFAGGPMVAPRLDVNWVGLMVKLYINVKCYHTNQCKDISNELISQHVILVLISSARSPWESVQSKLSMGARASIPVQSHQSNRCSHE